MAAEHGSLLENHTWSLVAHPPRANVVIGKWIFKHKFHSDGSLARYKAQWVVRSYSQQQGIDYGKTFSLVVKLATILIVPSLSVSRGWPIHQLDVKNALLHATLDETIYCQRPSRFIDPHHPQHVCHLLKSLYGLKQAPHVWYQHFATYICTIGFVASSSDTSLFVFKDGADIAYLLLYIDDIILTDSPTLFLVISSVVYTMSLL